MPKVEVFPISLLLLFTFLFKVYLDTLYNSNYSEFNCTIISE